MFTLSVIFGLFHGLVLLPVILSIFGPQYQEQDGNSDLEENKSTEEQELSRINAVKNGFQGNDNLAFKRAESGKSINSPNEPPVDNNNGFYSVNLAMKSRNDKGATSINSDVIESSRL